MIGRRARGSRGRRALAIAAALAAVASCAGSARAYCRSTTRQGPPSARCDQPCVTDGAPLAWRRPCISVALHERGAPGVPRERLEAVIDGAFARWTTQLACPGDGRVALAVRRRPEPVPCDRDHFTFLDGNVNVIAFIDDWEARDYPWEAYALTQVKFLTRDGTILDSDMLFNAERWDFAACPASGCADGRVDLENTFVHEIGHFFGLAHTATDPEATMWACAAVGEVHKRDLASDDVAGMCAIYGGQTFEGVPCNDEPIGGFDGACPAGLYGRVGCAIAPPPKGGPRRGWIALALLSTVFGIGRYSRRR